MSDPRDEDDDAALFRDAIGPVRKLPESPPPPMPARPRPRARMAERDEAAARDEFRLALDEHLAAAGDVLAAWIYVALRIVHSLWQATVNVVSVRFLLFLASSLALFYLAFRALMLTLFADPVLP